LNGKPYENLDVVSGERVRLRFINTANARILRFEIEGHEPWIAAIDGQPIPLTRLPDGGISIAPSQRIDLVLDIKGNAGDRFAIVETSGEEPLAAGYLNLVDGANVAEKRTLLPLKSNQLPEPLPEPSIKLDLLMSGGAMRFLTEATFKGEVVDGRTLARTHRQMWAFNGQAGMSEAPLFSAKTGETVVLTMINETAWPHAIHLHGHHFRVLRKGPLQSRELASIEDEEKNAFRDTVLLARDEIIEIAFVADNPGKWMLHCHMLEHQASGMGTWFEVT
jgi:FtsP/CotA-like multicopper oxidase with cupredoxin domain